MKVILTFYSGEVREFHTNHHIFTIGRSARATIPVAEEGISRLHCQIEVKNSGEIYVTDLGSTNGVLIDGKKIPSETQTLYNSFLTLSFGPIQALQIVNEEVNTISPSIRGPSSKATKKGKHSTGEVKIKKADQKDKERPAFSSKLLVVILCSLALVGALYFVIHQQDSEEEGLPLPPRKIHF